MGVTNKSRIAMDVILGNKGMLPCDGTTQPKSPQSIFDIINRSKVNL